MTDPTPEPQPPPDPPQDPPTPPQDDDLGDLAGLDPKALAAMVKNLRKENAARRAAGDPETAAQTAREQERQQLLGQLAPGLKALGIDLQPDSADPAKLQADLEQLQLAQRTAQVENGVLRYAAEAGGNADALLDSKTFARRVAGLDPAAADFKAKILSEVQNHITEHPTAKLAPAVSKAGAPINGGSGEGGKVKANSLDEAINAHYAGQTL